jgi:hypothetical protein
MDAAIKRILRDAVETGALPANPSAESLVRVARTYRDGAETR